jgi:hypothetical protein
MGHRKSELAAPSLIAADHIKSLSPFVTGQHDPGMQGRSEGDSDPDATRRHAATESPLHRRYARQGLAVLVGQKKAVAIAARNVSGRRRWSKLSEWLAAKIS